MGAYKADATLDVTNVECPMTFVKALFALEELEDGQVLEIRLNEGEPVENVPDSLKDEGYNILQVGRNEDGTYTILVEKCPLAAQAPERRTWI